MRESDDNILGCFLSFPATYAEADQETVERLREKGELFRSYIWSDLGICDSLKRLRRSDYGKDLDFVLLKFYLLPLIVELVVLKDIERYRPKERAIGIPIIIHDENFFNRSDLERRRFLKNVILEKLDLLARVIQRNKLDTNFELLKSDIEGISF